MPPLFNVFTRLDTFVDFSVLSYLLFLVFRLLKREQSYVARAHRGWIHKYHFVLLFFRWSQVLEIELGQDFIPSLMLAVKATLVASSDAFKV